MRTPFALAAIASVLFSVAVDSVLADSSVSAALAARNPTDRSHTEYHDKQLDAINHHLNDYHETTVEFMQLPDELTPYPHFLVEVDRHDALTDVNNADPGSEQVVAHKFTHIVLAFDVTPNRDVTLNGKPVPMGISHLRVEADKLQLVKKPSAIAADANGHKINATKEELLDAMDKGVVGVTVHVEAKTLKLADGVEIEMFKISEMITEVNGEEVEQHKLLQQIVELNVDGVVRTKMVKPSIEIVHQLQAVKESKARMLAAECAAAVHRLSVAASIILCIAVGCIFSGIVFLGAWLLSRSLVRRSATTSYCPIALSDDDVLLFDGKEPPIYDEVAREEAESRNSEKQSLANTYSA